MRLVKSLDGETELGWVRLRWHEEEKHTLRLEVVGARIPNTIASQLWRTEMLDGVGPARFVDPTQLNIFNQMIQEIWRVGL